MSEKKVLIEEASAAELREFAQNTLGMTLRSSMKLEELRAKVASAWSKPEIMVSVPEAETAPEGQPPRPVTAAQQKPGREMVRVLIHITENAGGADDVELGCNGKIMLVPRGKEVDIPIEFFESLKNAVQARYDPVPDGGMSPPRKVQLYPYQRIA